jgi:hypothetical protein
MRKLWHFFFFLFGALTGFGTFLAIWTSGLLLPSDTVLVRRHSHRLEEYQDFMRDKENWERDTVGTFVEPPFDIDPSLAMLVSLGELEHVDLVLPTVPESAEVNTLVMQYVEDHDDILFMYGNPEYRDFPTSGQGPLHLNLWFRKTGSSDMKELITRLESEFGSQEIASHSQNKGISERHKDRENDEPESSR